MDSIRVSKVQGVRCTKANSSGLGTIHLTPHHLIFHYDDSNRDEIWVPYPLISLVQRLPQTLYGQCPITFHLRNFESLTFTFDKESSASDVFESVKELTVAISVTQLYAFYYRPNPPLPSNNGWSLYSLDEELSRMGVGTRSKAWRVTSINEDYSFCPTYPSRLVVPAKISDSTLQYASKYRSKARIPALTYLHWANLGSITRSSQPMVGITQNRSLQDEKLIETIFQTHHSLDNRQGHSNSTVYGATATNLIIDARPTTNAVANTAKGAGTENMDHYKGAKKAYLGIDNIHVMRDSLTKVVEALRDADTLAASISNDLSGDIKGLSLIDRQALRRSGWLRHISAILEGTRLIARNVHVNSSHVLIHCSDGWDRTSQLSSLTQICLDPFYRTMRGFAVLIEKDWLSFGFKFLDRCGHLSSEKFFVSPTETTVMGGGPGAEAAQAFLASMQNRFASQHHVKETSPVFHQFLEAVRQVQRQFPERFEFNERFLRQIHYHLYSCQFGTFLFNDERSRRKPDVGGGTPLYGRTTSIWDWLLASQERELNLNAEYNPALDDPASRAPKADMGVLMPNPKDVRFWNELYGKTDEEMNGRVVSATAQQATTEVVGPITNGSEDPVLDTATSLQSLGGDDRAPTPTPTTPVPSPPSTPTRFGQQQQSSRAGTSPANSVPQFERSDTQESFKPFDSTSSAISLRQSAAPLSSSAAASPSASGPPDLFGNIGGMKSMWGKLSSNASAAFSVVQDVYGGVARDMKGLALGNEERTGAMSSRDDLTASWTGESSSSASAGASSSPTQSSPRNASFGGSRTGSIGSMLPNPWATTSASSPSTAARRSRSPIPSIAGYDNPWNSVRASSAPPDQHPTLFEIGERDDPLLGTNIIGGPMSHAQAQPTLGATGLAAESGDPLMQALGNGGGPSAFKKPDVGDATAVRHQSSSSPRPQAAAPESNSNSNSMLDPLGVGLVS